jgi:uncharacterized iron-regulated membrane protein
MARRTPMQKLARWHIWLGWLVGVPLLLWTLSGLVMVARPIEEVRGKHLRIEPPAGAMTVDFGGDGSAIKLREGHIVQQRGRAILLATLPDGRTARYDLARPAAGPLPPLSEAEARAAVAAEIVGGKQVVSVRLFPADQPPLDFRRPVAAWQVVLADGTHVYVGQDSGAIEAVRTRWWRTFDFMWGLHIMDLENREDTHHPLLIGFAALALIGCLIGTVLLFRRRRRPISR